MPDSSHSGWIHHSLSACFYINYFRSHCHLCALTWTRNMRVTPHSLCLICLSFSIETIPNTLLGHSGSWLICHPHIHPFLRNQTQIQPVDVIFILKILFQSREFWLLYIFRKVSDHCGPLVSSLSINELFL